MTGKDRSRFDVETLRSLAGGKVFARGLEYHRDGSVELLAVEPDRVLAKVAGTDNYRTALRGRGTEVDGECTCPAFEDWGFCKHMVAVALAANECGADDAPESAGSLTRIREYLRSKGVDALVEIVIDLAERDSALFDRLHLAAAMIGADDKTLEVRLQRAIDDATRINGFVSYFEASGWAARVEEVFAAVADLAGSGRAALAIKLAVHAIDRIEVAIEHIDDSDGLCGDLLRWAGEVHLKACRAASPDPIELAGELFEREMDDPYDAFSGAVAFYADVLGESGLAEYRRLACEAWDRLPAHVGRADLSGDYGRLESILEFFAERDGDLAWKIHEGGTAEPRFVL